MERQSDKHGPRLDDAMSREVESLTHGAPIESRIDPRREMEDGGDGEPTPEGVIEELDAPANADALSHFDVRRRSELAIALRPSIFPATRTELVECAQEEGAAPDLVDALARLPEARAFRTTEEVWEALGGHREHRTAEPKPDAPTPRVAGAPAAPPEGQTRASAVQRFGFRFDRLHRLFALPFGVTPGRAHVDVDHRSHRLVARFGPWCVETTLENVEHLEITGGYFPAKTVGGAHLSLADRGLTFATNDREGVCIGFREPVPGIDPGGLIRHRALTVTVDDTEAFIAALR
jgi:hypothetical protein